MGTNNGNVKKVGQSSESIKQRMLSICPTEYKVYWIWSKFAPELVPDCKTFDELKKRYESKFPKNITEEQAEVWMYEKPVQNALKELMKCLHEKKMIELYNIYFEKAKSDVQAFKAFTDFSKTFFENNEENELAMLLKGIKLDEGDEE